MTPNLEIIGDPVTHPGEDRIIATRYLYCGVGDHVAVLYLLRPMLFVGSFNYATGQGINATMLACPSHARAEFEWILDRISVDTMAAEINASENRQE